jgi:hypothetical protein
LKIHGNTYVTSGVTNVSDPTHPPFEGSGSKPERHRLHLEPSPVVWGPKGEEHAGTRPFEESTQADCSSPTL